MSVIIVALPKIEDAKRVRRVLLSHGYDNVVPCGTGAAALMEANNENRGLIICAARLPDMHYSELLEYMPRFYELLLLGSGSAVSDAGGDVMALTMPLKIHDFINTVEMLLAQADRRYKKEKKKKPPARNERDENYIRNAKYLLMERNHLTEEAAYRYIQKRSMDNGTNMVETAQMILMLIWDETD